MQMVFARHTKNETVRQPYENDQSVGVDNGLADAGRESIARSNFQARAGREDNFPYLAAHEQDWQPYSVDSQSAESDHQQ